MARPYFTRVAKEVTYGALKKPIPPQECDICGISFHEHVFIGELRQPRKGEGKVTDGTAICWACSNEQLSVGSAERLRRKMRERADQMSSSRLIRGDSRKKIAGCLVAEPETVKEPEKDYEMMWYGAESIRSRHDITPEEQWRQRRRGRYACYQTGEFLDVNELIPMLVRERGNLPSRRDEWRRISLAEAEWQQEYNELVKKEQNYWGSPTDYDLGEVRDRLNQLEEMRPSCSVEIHKR